MAVPLQAVPAELLLQQTNSQNQVGDPFMNLAPSLPGGWTTTVGTATYAYQASAAGSFTVCATGDGVAVDSNGRTVTAGTCP
ncbi:MAG: hypothetical protein ACRELS_05540 [Candidatus Rokuibacteriota bacterium]